MLLSFIANATGKLLVEDIITSQGDTVTSHYGIWLNHIKSENYV